jgi:FMN phosphatase YigB (HAD superfamily)
MITTIIFDFFGVICSEISPIWFRNNFGEKLAFEMKNRYMDPFDKGLVSENDLFNSLSKIAGKNSEAIRKEWSDLIQINQSMKELVIKLKHSYKIGLLSNANKTFLASIMA